MTLIDPTCGASIDTHAVVASLLDPPAALPVLDVAAGKGNFTAHLVSEGYAALATDIDEHDYLQSGLSTAEFVTANIDESGLPWQDGSVAGVVCIEAVEHFEAPLLAIREMARVVVAGGFVIVSTPNVSSLGSRLELLVRGHHEDFDDFCYATNGHISPVSLTQIVRVGSRCGLSVEVETYNVGRLPLPRLHKRPLRGPRWRRAAFGETLIVKLRKVSGDNQDFVRG